MAASPRRSAGEYRCLKRYCRGNSRVSSEVERSWLGVWPDAVHRLRSRHKGFPTARSVASRGNAPLLHCAARFRVNANNPGRCA